MLKITDIIIDPLTLGSKLWLVDIHFKRVSASCVGTSISTVTPVFAEISPVTVPSVVSQSGGSQKLTSEYKVIFV